MMIETDKDTTITCEESATDSSASIVLVSELLNDNLTIPGYQRPYRWSASSVLKLLEDIKTAAESEFDAEDSFRYRVGTVIIHNNAETGALDIVDGQQRLVTLALIKHCLSPDDSSQTCPLLEEGLIGAESKANVKRNYQAIMNWFSQYRKGDQKRFDDFFDARLEAVLIIVNKLSEAFQLFDSQNTRGRALNPHDLLKAYHLRAMRDRPHDMKHAVAKWESFPSEKIADLFSGYLFPISAWMRKEKSRKFTTREIDDFKGISAETGYTYAHAAWKTLPYYQIGQPFIEGKPFFEMVAHYLELLEDIKEELSTDRFSEIKSLLDAKGQTIGMSYAKRLFECALLHYYDRFGNFDTRAIDNLFAWAIAIRVDMEHLGFDSVNKYAIGENNYSESYTNVIPMFAFIARARKHTDISNLTINAPKEPRGNPSKERKRLFDWFRQV